MNVKVCTFPDGDDPDSFARKTSFEDLQLYFEENAKDFIQFKASLLMQEAKNDPIKKADLIRDMVVSISKIPDRIKREVYIKECSRIMDISEDVLFNTLAQLVKKDLTEANKHYKEEQKAFQVVKNDLTEPAAKVDIQYELEHKIIQILLLYGSKEVEFEDSILTENEEGEYTEVIEKKYFKVFQRVYMSLQEDEVELANPLFKAIYNHLITYFNENEAFELEKYLIHLPEELAHEVTSILMNEEREVLHKWEIQQIYVKQKEETISQYVTETMITLRWYLVNNIIDDLKNNLTTEEEQDNRESLEMVMAYLGLTHIFSKRLGRVLSRYH
jgi:DNA primase